MKKVVLSIVLLIALLVVVLGLKREDVRDVGAYVSEQYDDVFLRDYPNPLAHNIQCDKGLIISNKSYYFKSADYIEYYCSNGKIIVYRFEKSIGRSVMLADWRPDNK